MVAGDGPFATPRGLGNAVERSVTTDRATVFHRLMMGFRVTARLSGGIAHLVGWVATQLSQGVALSKLGLDPAYHYLLSEV